MITQAPRFANFFAIFGTRDHVLFSFSHRMGDAAVFLDAGYVMITRADAEELHEALGKMLAYPTEEPQEPPAESVN